MAKCPGCGAEMHFDIKAQQLKCDNCGKLTDPYEFDGNEGEAQRINDSEAGYIDEKAGKKEEAGDSFTVNVFTCPNCGGEIISTSNAAVEFCTYCGSSVMLEGRLDQAKRPDYIVPFKKDRDDCRRLCRGRLRRAVFAPREMRDPKSIDSFRGLYMPYWIFDMKKNGKVVYTGENSYREGDYKYTKQYDVKCDIDAEYDGLSFDASSSFDDSVSEAVEPYNMKDAVRFAPGFISGFYADTADVPSETYELDAVVFAERDVNQKVRGCKEVGSVIIKNAVSVFDKDGRSTKSALLPAWFMTYRKNDRVAYAVINGQTGKLAMDMPIDWKKYLAGSLLLAVPIFMLLQLIFMPTAPGALTVAMILTLMTVATYTSETVSAYARDHRLYDAGYNSAAKADSGTDSKVSAKEASKEQYRKKRMKMNGEEPSDDAWICEIAIIIAGLAALGLSAVFGTLITVGIFMIVIALFEWIEADDMHEKLKMSMRLSFAAVIAGLLICLIEPINDMIYYVMTTVLIVFIGFMMVEVIKKYNVLSTRKLPQFRREGGDNRA